MKWSEGLLETISIVRKSNQSAEAVEGEAGCSGDARKGSRGDEARWYLHDDALVEGDGHLRRGCAR